MTCFELDTNRRPEAFRIHRLRRLPGVELWSIKDATSRCILSDAFTACLVLGGIDRALGTCFLRGERSFGAGDVMLTEPGEIQQISSAPEPVALFMMRWETSVLQRVANELGATGPLRFKEPMLEPGPHSEAMARLNTLLTDGAEADVVEAAYVEATARIVERALRSDAGPRARATHAGVRRVIERLRTDFDGTEPLDEFAKEARLSKFHFARCFRQATGVAPLRYRKLLRLLAAKRRLEGGMTVVQTAEESGFADASHLNRAFREWLGVTPWAWGSAWRASDPWPTSRPQTIAPPAI